MMIVVCNLATPAIRKSSILEEMSSLTFGLLVVVFIFCVTWAMAPLAYIRFPSIALPDFFPAFQVLGFCHAMSCNDMLCHAKLCCHVMCDIMLQVLNSFIGIFVFMFLGLANVRFRAVVTGRVQDRVTILISRVECS